MNFDVRVFGNGYARPFHPTREAPIGTRRPHPELNLVDKPDLKTCKVREDSDSEFPNSASISLCVSLRRSSVAACNA
jgi:hypothetical protein